MQHELYNKTDKQLLKSNKVDLVAYIRTLEGTLDTYVNNAVEPLDSEANVYDTTQPSITQPSHDLVNTKRKTSMVIGDTTNHTGLYNF